jgi:hypothetical protein
MLFKACNQQLTYMPQTIPVSAILRQLKADLIGKDSYRGVTLSYSWLANQFGHFGLGFIPAFIVYKILLLWWPAREAALWAAVGVSFAWLAFEIINFLGPLLSHQQKKRKRTAKGDYTFQPAWGNVAFDTATDVLFFSLGAFTASVLLYWSSLTFIVVMTIALILVYPSYYWYVTKLYLQTAQYPFHFRLSQWNFEMPDDKKEIIQQFKNNKDKGMHLLIFGAKGCGKTSLGVAVATEHSITHRCCIYTTGIKLYGLFFDPFSPKKEKDGPLWNWRACTTLVIDDINPGEPVKEDIVSPRSFIQFLDNYGSVNQVNRDTLKRTNVIWILGTEVQPVNTAGKWRQMLLNELGIDENKILCLYLN